MRIRAPRSYSEMADVAASDAFVSSMGVTPGHSSPTSWSVTLLLRSWFLSQRYSFYKPIAVLSSFRNGVSAAPRIQVHLSSVLSSESRTKRPRPIRPGRRPARRPLKSQHGSIS